MTSTKKGFLKAGSIIAIISAVLTALFSFIFIGVASIIDEELILESYETEIGYAYYEETDGGYYIEYYEDEDDLHVTVVKDEDIKQVVKFTKIVLFGMSIFVLSLSIAQFVMAILILSKMSKDKSSKGQIIALLVLSAISGTIVTAAFMIVALCLKDRPQATLENVKDIAAEQTTTIQESKENKEE